MGLTKLFNRDRRKEKEFDRMVKERSLGYNPHAYIQPTVNDIHGKIEVVEIVKHLGKRYGYCISNISNKLITLENTKYVLEPGWRLWVSAEQLMVLKSSGVEIANATVYVNNTNKVVVRWISGSKPIIESTGLYDLDLINFNAVKSNRGYTSN